MAVQWESSDGRNCTGYYGSYEKKVILLSVGCTSLLSISLCVVAIVLVFRFKLHTKFAYRLASYQVIASMLISFTVLLATIPIIGEFFFIFCKITGFLLEYFLWVKLISVLCLVFHIFCFAVFSKNFKKYEKRYIAVSLCFPLIFTWIPFIHGSYGLTQSWCWIRDAKCNADRYSEGYIEQFVLWFGPLAVSIIVSLIAIIAILVAFKCRYNKVVESNNVSETDPLIETEVKAYMQKMYFRKLIPMLIYPLVFFILFLYPVAQPRRLHHSLSSHVNFRIGVAHSVCYASFGLLSSLSLIFHVLLVRHLKSWNEYFFPVHESLEPSLNRL